ncbi:MAG: hypothetical protein ING10_16315 [Roseomonas sp.]|nr:hypothetical protein [Roseomonas sp.]
MRKIEDDPLPALERRVAYALAGTVREFIEKAVQTAPGRNASPACKKLVAKRVPPALIAKYDILDDYGLLIWDEAMTILDRILVYPFTVTYRRHLFSAPQDVRTAWQFHSHSLRVGEIYIVQDRTSALLKFLNVVMGDLGFSVIDQSRNFEQKFKKAFDWHLRERHRLTHAHERPSMTSRIIDFLGAKLAENSAESTEAIARLMIDIQPRLIQMREASGGGPMNTLEDFVAFHELSAQREARKMLSLFREALLGTINHSLEWPANR